MPRAGLTRKSVTDQAAQLLEEVGWDGLTLASVAERLGVRAPSLYKHVDGLPGLRHDVAIQAKAGLAEALARSSIGKARGDAIRSLAVAYRQWALDHPAQYALTNRPAAEGDEDDRQATFAGLNVIYGVLDGYGLRDDDAVDATRFLRSALHGFIALEISGAFQFPVDLERSYSRLVKSITTALDTWEAP